MSYTYICNEYKIIEYAKSEITDDLVDLIKKYCEVSFENRRESYEYYENYIWNHEDVKTLAYKFFNQHFEYIYLVYLNDEFLSFSGLYLKNGIAFGGARRFSSIHSPIKPYHLAYVIPQQLKRSKELASKAFVVPYNFGVRNKYFDRIVSIIEKSINADHFSNEYSSIKNFCLNNEVKIQRTPVLCNGVFQYLIYFYLENEITQEDFFERIK